LQLGILISCVEKVIGDREESHGDEEASVPKEGKRGSRSMRIC
jgi:hypothetical protein